MPDAESYIEQAKSHLIGFGQLSTEEKHGAIKHAIAELENARRELDDEY